MTTPREELAKYVTQSQMSSFFTDSMKVHNVKSYGAVGDGVADDTTAIQDTIDAAGAAGGGIVFLPAGVYLIVSMLEIGDGTTLANSTYNGVHVMGAGSGVSADILGACNGATTIKWGGALNGTMLKVVGPIHNAKLEGFKLDCNDLAAVGAHLVHMAYSNVKDVYVSQYRQTAWIITTVDGTTAFAYGACANLWEKFGCGDPATSTACGLLIDGNEGSTLDTCRNTFINGEIIYGGNTTNSYGYKLHYTDNNTFIECIAMKSGGYATGHDWLFSQSTVNTSFPYGNTFVNTAGDVSGLSGSNGNWFLPYSDDGSGVPIAPQYVHSMMYDGRMIKGSSSGAQQRRALSQVTQVALSSALQTTTNVYANISDCAVTLTGLTTNSRVEVFFAISGTKGTGGNGQVLLAFNTSNVAETNAYIGAMGYPATINTHYIFTPSAAGNVTVVPRFRSDDANTFTVTERVMIARELY